MINSYSYAILCSLLKLKISQGLLVRTGLVEILKFIFWIHDLNYLLKFPSVFRRTLLQLAAQGYPYPHIFS